MKKFILTLVAACAVAFSANAQFYGSASAGFRLGGQDGNTNNSWNVAPGFGYKISDRCAVGLFLNLGGQGSAFVWDINPYFRYTFAKVSKVGFFGEANLKFGQVGKAFNWSAGLRPGLYYEFSPKFKVFSRLGFIGVGGVGGSTSFALYILRDTSFGVEFAF